MLQSNRLHAMDALRAVMMLLGVVLHAAETYTLGEDLFWPKDASASNVFYNYLNSLIHLFRMPMFFLIAGFFGALLFYERGFKAMVSNRVSRIVFPFVVFLCLLHPLISWSANRTAIALGTTLSPRLTDWSAYPVITYHLWFLYYLILITICFVLVGITLKQMSKLTRHLKHSFEWLIQRRWLFIIIFTLIIFFLLVWMWDTWASTPLSFVPEIELFIFYSVFYGVGWLFYKSKHLLQNMLAYDRLFLTLAFTIFTLKFIFRIEVGDVLFGALNALIIWFVLFGLMGVFLRYANHHSPRMRYLSDGSYWIYLIHLPFTLLIPGLLADTGWSVHIKFLVVLFCTSVICSVSYHYVVRGTFIGAFLNGRKYPKP
ncbi:MAG: acyltransferase family protein [Bacteroidota bacterium]